MSRKHSDINSVLGEVGFVNKRQRHSVTINNMIVIKKRLSVSLQCNSK